MWSPGFRLQLSGWAVDLFCFDLILLYLTVSTSFSHDAHDTRERSWSREARRDRVTLLPYSLLNLPDAGLCFIRLTSYEQNAAIKIFRFRALLTVCTPLAWIRSVFVHLAWFRYRCVIRLDWTKLDPTRFLWNRSGPHPAFLFRARCSWSDLNQMSICTPGPVRIDAFVLRDQHGLKEVRSNPLRAKQVGGPNPSFIFMAGCSSPSKYIFISYCLTVVLSLETGAYPGNL